MRRFVVIGQRATASADFSLLDVPGTAGRLDLLLRFLRAALLVSHGLRRDTQVYLALYGGPEAPRALRFDGATARFVRPDERSLATLVQKSLAAAPRAPRGAGFVEVRPGVFRAEDGLEAVLADLGPGETYALEEGAPDLRAATLDLANPVFFVGDAQGFAPEVRARIAALGARPLGAGPVSLHAEDAVTVVVNELDRRAASR
jgi:tRNA (pseudouridine54-N1)-methyltransferase